MSRPVSQTIAIARARGILPTYLNTADLRAQLTARARAHSVYSARVHNRRFLHAVQTLTQQILAQDTDINRARVTLRSILDSEGYTPRDGFPDDPDGIIPPAEPGDLRDLRSSPRLNLILRTQTDLNRGRAKQLQGLEPDNLRTHPAWELVRTQFAQIPRDWPTRWATAGGDPALPLIAHKLSPIWENLGDSLYYDDALDTGHPPFAFNSGMSWRAVPADEFDRLAPYLTPFQRDPGIQPQATAPAPAEIIQQTFPTPHIPADLPPPPPYDPAPYEYQDILDAELERAAASYAAAA